MKTDPTESKECASSKTRSRVSLEDYQRSLRRCRKPELVLMLAAIKARIGTQGEYPEDRAHSNAICHQLKNIHLGARLHESIRKMDWGYRPV